MAGLIGLVGLLSGCTAEETTVDTETWPHSTIKIIVPFTAGGGTDLTARAMAPYLSDRLGVSVVVENQVGGGGAIAMNGVAHSGADGYTLVYTTVGTSTLTPNSSDVGYIDADFAPIAQTVDAPNVFCVPASSEATSWEAYLEMAQRDGDVTYGTSGAGLTQNVQVERMLRSTAQDGLLIHVPFDGGSAVITALLGEQVDAAMNTMGEAIPHIESGAFRPLFVTSEDRLPELPDVPTAQELGYDVVGGVWFGFAAPDGTPQAIIDKIDEAIYGMLEEAEIIEAFERLGTPMSYLNAEAFTTRWQEDYATNQAYFAQD